MPARMEGPLAAGKPAPLDAPRQQGTEKPCQPRLGRTCAGRTAQTAAMIGTSAVISEVDWVMVASASVLSGLLSLLTSVAGLPGLKTE